MQGAPSHCVEVSTESTFCREGSIAFSRVASGYNSDGYTVCSMYNSSRSIVSGHHVFAVNNWHERKLGCDNSSLFITSRNSLLIKIDTFYPPLMKHTD